MGDNEYLYGMSPAQLVFATDRFALGRSNCPVDHPHFGLTSEPQTAFYLAFHRSSVRLRIGASRAETVTPNNVTLLNPGQSYAREATGTADDERDFIALSPFFLRRVIAGLPELESVSPRFAFRRPFAPVSSEDWLDLRRLFLKAPVLNRGEVEAALTGLVRKVITVAQEFWRGADRRRKSSRPSCHNNRAQMVEGAKAILARDYRAAHPLTDLATQLHCSLAHLSRAFRDATGLSLCDYRNELRLRSAMLLLEQSELDVGDIARHVGASSPSHFTHSFSARFGLSPSKYREFCKRDNPPLKVRSAYAANHAVASVVSP